MDSKILRISLIAALAGFLFGFDTVVISGAEKKLQLLWESSDAFHGTVVIGMALFGTVVGAILGGFPTNKIGRKNTLIWIGILYSVSAIGSAFANDPVTFGIFRFIGGLGVGASTVAAPAYISEIAPAKHRGRLVGFYQFMLVFGILVAFLSNYMLSGMGENDWRWMVGVEAFPAIVYTLFVLSVPKSPRWLLTKGRREEAEKVLASVNPDLSIADLEADVNADRETAGENETIFIKKYRFPLILAFLISFFNQFSGINAFLYYAPR
ncbi:MAG: MFS transporter, partial [Bacteroidota bacterium]